MPWRAGQCLMVTVHRDKLKPLESRWGRFGGGDGLPLHPHRARSRLKPGEPIRSMRQTIHVLDATYYENMRPRVAQSQPLRGSVYSAILETA